MPPQRKRLGKVWTKSNAPHGHRISTSTSLRSGRIPQDVPMIDLRSPSPPAHSEVYSRTHRMPTPEALISPVQQNTHAVDSRPQPLWAPTGTGAFRVPEPHPSTYSAVRPYVPLEHLQQDYALVIDHRPQSMKAARALSQRKWLEDATRHIRTPNRTSLQPQSAYRQEWLDNATTFANQPAHTPQPVPSVRSCQPVTQPIAYKPQILHAPHPDSKILQDFHWVPYPLGLLPYDSWHRLHNRAQVFPPLPLRCPVCRKERKVSTHLQKVYLVAERLSWDDRSVTAPDKNLNEELNWAVNYELGILEPFVEDIEQINGGKRSQKNKHYPYRNGFEMKEALKLIFTADNITDTSWNLWVDLQKDIQRITGIEEMHGSVSSPTSTSQGTRKAQLSEISANARPNTPPVKVEEIDLSIPPQSALEPTIKGPASLLPTPPSSLPVASNTGNRASFCGYDQASLALPATKGTDKEASSRSERATPASTDRRILSYKTLPDFYSLLDQIERTSYVGALFLEAYAERLRDDMCKIAGLSATWEIRCKFRISISFVLLQ